jgi:hypothetical protein
MGILAEDVRELPTCLRKKKPEEWKMPELQINSLQWVCQHRREALLA